MNSVDITGHARGKNIMCRIVVMAVLLLFLSSAAYQRNVVWHTLLSLWEDATAKSPRKSRVHNNLGNCNLLLERYFKAIDEYKIAVALDKGNIEAYYNLGACLEKVGIINQAWQYYDVFCSSAPPSYAEQKKSACERAAALSRELKRPGP